MEGIECVTGNIPVKLCQDNSDLLRPHLLTASDHIDGLGDLPDVGAVLEQSGILDSTADCSTPNSLRCFDMSDFTMEDGNSGLPFDGILELSDGASSALPQNIPPPPTPSSGIFSWNGQGLQPLPYLVRLPLESIVQKQNVEIMHDGLNPFSTNLQAVPHLVINQGIISTTCNQKSNRGSQFVSSIFSGSDENRKLVSRTRSGLTFPNDRDAPEYQRVMDILTEYRVQVAEKSAEALMPCKRRKSRPLVDAVETAQSGTTALSQTGVVSSTERSPGKHVAPFPSQQHGHVGTDQPADLSSSDSLASSGSATDLPRASEQNTLGLVSENSHYVVDPKPVMSSALDVVVPQSVVSQQLSCNKLSPIQSNGLGTEVEQKLSFTPFCNGSSAANGSPSESMETSVNSYKRAAETPPECCCSDAGRYNGFLMKFEQEIYENAVLFVFQLVCCLLL